MLVLVLLGFPCNGSKRKPVYMNYFVVGFIQVVVVFDVALKFGTCTLVKANWSL